MARKDDSKKTKGKKRLPNKGSFQKGQTGNPNGRPKGLVTFKEVKKGFNNNYVEMAELFKKYLEMPDKDFNKAIERANNRRTKTPMQEILAIKFVSDATKRGHSGKLDIILGVITGQYGEGIREIPSYDLEKSDILSELEKCSKSTKFQNADEYLTSRSISKLMLLNTNMSVDKHRVLNSVAKLLQKEELSKYEMVKRQEVQEVFNKILIIMRDTVGRVNPRLLLDMVYQMHESISPTLELPKSMYSIEAEGVKTNNRGRPKGSKDSKPRKKRLFKKKGV